MASDPHPTSSGPTAPGRPESDTEVERYELSESPAYHFGLPRRDFVRIMGGVVGGGVAVVLSSPRLGAAGPGEPVTSTPPDGAPGPLETSAQGGRVPDGDLIEAWLHMAPDGSVTVLTGKVEVGQDIRTSLTQAVADELRLGTGAIRLVMGDTDLTPYDRGTFGSRTTPQMASQLRSAAATLRRILVERAAAEWNAARSNLQVEEGQVRDPSSGRSVPLGELAGREALTRRVAADAPVTPATEWTVAGRSHPKVGGRDMVTGAHRYVSDLRLPDMLHGRVLRPPAAGARLRRIDTTGAEALPGVVAVHDGDFVGVAAPDPATADRALERVEAEWDPPPPRPSHETLFRHFAEALSSGSGRGGRSRGSPEEAFDAGAARVEATYTLHYIAHVPMEPRAAVARWNPDGVSSESGRLTVWTGTQRPFGVREELARAFRLQEAAVQVLMPDTGGAYGGKHTGETAVEAARLARATGGRPVKLTWSRKEEFDWAYFRPAGVIRGKAAADAEGRLSAWELHNVNSGTAGLATPYDVPNLRERFHDADSPLRQGSYRALASVANTFARESLMDELAHGLGMDPLEFRLRNLSDNRLRAVLLAAADRFGWREGARTAGGGSTQGPQQESGRDHRPVPTQGGRRRGRGLACGIEKGGYLATCVEASTGDDPDDIRVERIVTAFECGAIVNPDHLRSQVEGCVVMGLGGALFEAIDFEGGQILNGRLADYRVPRFSDIPPMETVLLNRTDLPSAGAGEAPIIGIAPALAEALFQATGERRRGLPLART